MTDDDFDPYREQTFTGSFNLEMPDPLARLPALAERLGVKPCGQSQVGILLHTKDGRTYDALVLINALLVRMEGKT